MPSKNAVIVAKNLAKVYEMGEIKVHALRGVSLRINRGEIVSIMGPSGSGKSTLMNMLGCLDRPSSGEYFLDNSLVSNMTDDQLAEIRNQKVGFVFQNFNLLSRTSALNNVELPLRYAGIQEGRKERASKALEAVGLGNRIYHKPTELSGGEQQRVALARAIINNPSIIMADEPTGNLDSRSGDEIMKLLLKMNDEIGTTLIIVTHDSKISKMTQRIISLYDGKIKK